MIYIFFDSYKYENLIKDIMINNDSLDEYTPPKLPLDKKYLKYDSDDYFDEYYKKIISKIEKINNNNLKNGLLIIFDKNNLLECIFLYVLY